MHAHSDCRCPCPTHPCAGLDQPAVPQPRAPAAAGAAAAAGAPQQQAPAAAPADQPFDMFGAGGGGGGGGQAAGGPLAALRNNPQFQAMRAMVQQRPELLQPLLQVRRAVRGAGRPQACW